MSAHLYIEGGESKEDQIRCRAGFRKLLEKAGFVGVNMPRLSACGGRNSAFDDFKTAHAKSRAGDYIALLIDSEDPVSDIEKTWSHLKERDNWDKPDGAVDEQVLFMTTCMETWVLADRAALTAHYGHELSVNALPPLNELEQRDRHELFKRLTTATRSCSNAYAKGGRSFQIVGLLSPVTLCTLPSFARAIRILKAKL